MNVEFYSLRPPNLLAVVLWSSVSAVLRTAVRDIYRDAAGTRSLEWIRRVVGENLRENVIDKCIPIVNDPRFDRDGPPAMQYVVDRLVAEIAGEELAASN